MRRGFTLLETMIVVLIVTAISAIVLPSLASRVAAGRVGSAVQSLESGAALAAAEAMERGAIVAFVAEDWDGEWVLWAEEVEPARIAELLVAVDAALPPTAPEEDTRRTELASFEGVDLTDELPPLEGAAAGGFGAESGALDGMSGGLEAEEDAPLLPGEHERHVLGVFFPDGSCRTGPTVYLVAEDGRRRVVRFSPLTGRVDIRKLPSAQDEAEQSEARGDPVEQLGRPERPGAPRGRARPDGERPPGAPPGGERPMLPPPDRDGGGTP